MASVLDFLDTPELLAHAFTGGSWARSRAVLKAAFALPMDWRDRTLFAQVSGRRAPPGRPVKELVAAVGRGGGKDSIAAALAVFIATTGDFSRLRPGECGTIMCLATDRDQAGIAFQYIKELIAASPVLLALVKKIDGDRIELKNGVEIIVQTNNIRSPRGRTIAAAIYDEAAHWRGEDFANPDIEVDNAIAPGLMRFPGSLKIIISSVHRRAGLLHDKFAQYYGKNNDNVLVVLGTSMQFNPTLDAEEIDRQLALDPEKAGAEYLSRWRDDLSTFLDRALVEMAIDTAAAPRPRKPGCQYMAFADPSGGRGDAFTAAVGHREGNLLIVDALYERRAPFAADAAVADVAALADTYSVHTIRGDDYGADLTVAAFRRHGITYRSFRLGDADGANGKRTRSEIYLNAIGLFTTGRVRLPANPRLVHQLISLERRAARSSGHDTVDHPPGGHDDLANACCGCLVALAGRPAPLILSHSQIIAAHRAPPRNRFVDQGRCRFARAV
jgi:hypothetical protein